MIDGAVALLAHGTQPSEIHLNEFGFGFFSLIHLNTSRYFKRQQLRFMTSLGTEPLCLLLFLSYIWLPAEHRSTEKRSNLPLLHKADQHVGRARLHGDGQTSVATADVNIRMTGSYYTSAWAFGRNICWAQVYLITLMRSERQNT